MRLRLAAFGKAGPIVETVQDSRYPLPRGLRLGPPFASDRYTAHVE
jgi:hypothetical protein